MTPHARSTRTAAPGSAGPLPGIGVPALRAGIPALAAFQAGIPALVCVAVGLLLFPRTGAGQEGPTGTIVVVNKGPGTASIVDLGSDRLLARLPTGDGPHEVAITSDGNRAVVTDYGGRAGGSTLTVIDVPGLRVERTIDLGEHRRPHGIAFLPGDEIVAVTAEASEHVVLVRVADGEVVGELPTGHPGSHMLAIPAAGGRIYTGNIADATVSELDVGGLRLVRTLPGPPEPEAIGVTPDGSEVWVGSNAEGTVSVIRPGADSPEPEVALEGFGWPYRILFTPDASLVFVPDLRGHELRVAQRTDHREVARLEFPEAGPQGLTLAGDRWLLQSLSRRAQVAVIDLETMQVVRTIEVGESPDGIAYTSRTVIPSN